MSSNVGGASGDEFKLRDFVILGRFSVRIRYWNAFSGYHIVYFELMFGMGCLTDADGEGGVLFVYLSVYGDCVAQVCMGDFIEGAK